MQGIVVFWVDRGGFEGKRFLFGFQQIILIDFFDTSHIPQIDFGFVESSKNQPVVFVL
jgi:hypothetical protein